MLDEEGKRYKVISTQLKIYLIKVKVFLKFLLLTPITPFSSVSIVDFEQVNVS